MQAPTEAQIGQSVQPKRQEVSVSSQSKDNYQEDTRLLEKSKASLHKSDLKQESVYNTPNQGANNNLQNKTINVQDSLIELIDNLNLKDLKFEDFQDAVELINQPTIIYDLLRNKQVNCYDGKKRGTLKNDYDISLFSSTGNDTSKNGNISEYNKKDEQRKNRIQLGQHSTQNLIQEGNSEGVAQQADRGFTNGTQDNTIQVQEPVGKQEDIKQIQIVEHENLLKLDATKDKPQVVTQVEQAKQNISLRFEKMKFDEQEVEVIVQFLNKNLDKINIRQIWLFNSNLSDRSIDILSQLVNNVQACLQEIHFSHNNITNKGFVTLLKSLRPIRPYNGVPLWLRVEYNQIDIPQALQFIKELQRDSGIKVYIPKVTENVNLGRDFKMSVQKGLPKHQSADQIQEPFQVTIPWFVPECQSKAPSLPPILKQSKSAYNNNIQKFYELPFQKRNFIESQKQNVSGGSGNESIGPIFLFPDTSALLAMLGAHDSAEPTQLSFDFLEQLYFQKLLQNSDSNKQRIQIVISDSVMKQVESLKHTSKQASTRRIIQNFLGNIIDKFSVRYDMLTILGAHEGEGILLKNQSSVTGSESNQEYLKLQGMKMDLKIIEVALFFQNFLLGNVNQEDSLQDISKPLNITKDLIETFIPVVLLSNDLYQVQVARSHGLPAFRLAQNLIFDSDLVSMHKGSKVFNAASLRQIVKVQSCQNIQSPNNINMQQEFGKALDVIQKVLHMLYKSSEALKEVKLASKNSTQMDSKTIYQVIEKAQEDMIYQYLQLQNNSLNLECNTPIINNEPQLGTKQYSIQFNKINQNILQQIETWKNIVHGDILTSKLTKKQTID